MNRQPSEPQAAPDAAQQPGRRALCAQCLRAQGSCICALACVLAPEVEVLILQHPLEVRQAKGSARLLHLCLRNSRLLVGETFAAATLTAHLHAGARTPLLLYPPYVASGLECLSPPAELASLPALAKLRLVLLDGTWRKSRKMLYLNPALQALPRLSLHDAPPSHYHIRKAHAPDQLSSLEACAQALMQLENDAEKYQPLLAAFDAFVARWPVTGR